MNCLAHVSSHAADYFLILYNYFAFITMLVCIGLIYQFIMAALCNTAGHYIFAVWFLSIYLSFFLSFFPRLISAAAD